MYKKILVVLAVVACAALISVKPTAAATCESTYGGGQTCTNTSGFTIKKEVREVNGGHFDFTVNNVKKGDNLEFRITVKNTGDTALNNVAVTDNMPDGLNSSDKLNFTIDQLNPGDSKSFLIVAQVNDSQFVNIKSGKCFVNSATMKVGDNSQKDTAAVCIGGAVLGAVKLPETGAADTAILSLVGVVIGAIGVTLKKFIK